MLLGSFAAIFLVLIFHHGEAFNVVRPLRVSSAFQLHMGGGRSPAEKGMSKKQMFRAVRDKVFEAAKVPGFFDVGEGPPDLTLYCKSNRDGTQISDCPDTQFLQLVMLKKKLRYTVVPTLPERRPEWLMEKHSGQLPALHNRDGTTLVGSLAIAEYLEEKHPHISLSREGTYTYQEVLDKTRGFFPALTAFILNKDPAQEETVREEMYAQLDLLDRLLRSTPGRYTSGIEMTLADLYLAPQLFHAVVTMDKFKHDEILNFSGDPVRPGLETFMTLMFGMKEFNDKKAYYNMDQVIYGWRVARGEAQTGPKKTDEDNL